tara:strand:+ start:218205 stop:218483 length:279 start_codon:yes stop_codon:yes gene_type:complete
MNWYSNLRKTAQFGGEEVVDDGISIDSRPRRYRGSIIFEVRVPDGQDQSINNERAREAAEDLLSRLQGHVGDEVLFVDENSLTDISGPGLPG